MDEVYCAREPALRMGWIDHGAEMPVVRQCELAGVARATWYARQRPGTVCQQDLDLMRRLDEAYPRHPFYGSRRMVVYLHRQGYAVNRKRVQRLMHALGLAGMAPGWRRDRRPACRIRATRCTRTGCAA